MILARRYRCSDEFNETLIRDTADALVSEGYKDAGYEYVCLDDCWQGQRDKDGHLAANPVKFPSGIKALAAYVHSKGLKLGLYTAVGSTSCKRKPARQALVPRPILPSFLVLAGACLGCLQARIWVSISPDTWKYAQTCV